MGALREFRLACRSLSKQRSFFSIGVVTLAIAIGGASTVFTVLNAVVLRPLPLTAPDRLVNIRDASPPRFPSFSVAPGRFVEWQSRARVFDGIGAAQNANVNLTG